ncbi:MAG TPA: hypothetical protein VFU93_08965 [Acidimicrobiales bacterium]|nr:hypothetical protein [Acidimicrobiales bacterium]
MKRLLVLVALVLALPTAALAHVDRVAAAEPVLQVATTTTEAPNVADEPLPDPDEVGGSSSWLLVLMAIIIVAMVVLAVAFVRGRRPPG